MFMERNSDAKQQHLHARSNIVKKQIKLEAHLIFVFSYICCRLAKRFSAFKRQLRVMVSFGVVNVNASAVLLILLGQNEQQTQLLEDVLVLLQWQVPLLLQHACVLR